jgi:hypothetical protein
MSGGVGIIQSSKQQEAMGRHGAMGVVNPVVVHQDGGRVEVTGGAEEEAQEIPPTYDSIPSDQRR